MTEWEKMDEKVDKLLAATTAIERQLAAYVAAHSELHRSVERDINELRGEMFGSGMQPGIKGLLQSQITMCASVQAGKPKPTFPFWDSIAKIGVNVASAACIGFIYWIIMVYDKVK